MVSLSKTKKIIIMGTNISRKQQNMKLTISWINKHSHCKCSIHPEILKPKKSMILLNNAFILQEFIATKQQTLIFALNPPIRSQKGC